MPILSRFCVCGSFTVQKLLNKLKNQQMYELCLIFKLAADEEGLLFCDSRYRSYMLHCYLVRKEDTVCSLFILFFEGVEDDVTIRRSCLTGDYLQVQTHT